MSDVTDKNIPDALWDAIDSYAVSRHIAALHIKDPDAIDRLTHARRYLRSELSAIIAERDRYEAAIAEASDELSQDHGDLWPHVGWHVGQRLAEVLPLASEVTATDSCPHDAMHGTDDPAVWVCDTCGMARREIPDPSGPVSVGLGKRVRYEEVLA